MNKFLIIISSTLLVLVASIYLVRSLSPSSTNIPNKQSKEQWHTYNNSTISFNYPSGWIAGEVQIYGSSNEISFDDPQGKFRLTYYERINYNQQTGKSYSDFIEYMKIPYLKPTKLISDYELYQVLPRAGSEHINSVDFFSKNKPILSLELETLTQDEKDIKMGQELFSSMVNSFEILK